MLERRFHDLSINYRARNLIFPASWQEFTLREFVALETCGLNSITQ